MDAYPTPGTDLFLFLVSEAITLLKIYHTLRTRLKPIIFDYENEPRFSYRLPTTLKGAPICWQRYITIIGQQHVGSHLAAGLQLIAE